MPPRRIEHDGDSDSDLDIFEDFDSGAKSKGKGKGKAIDRGKKDKGKGKAKEVREPPYCAFYTDSNNISCLPVIATICMGSVIYAVVGYRPRGRGWKPARRR